MSSRRFKEFEQDQVLMVGCSTIDSTIGLIRRLGGPDGAKWNSATRKLISGVIIDFLMEERERISHLEWGVQRIMMQAAEHMGRELGKKERRK